MVRSRGRIIHREATLMNAKAEAVQTKKAVKAIEKRIKEPAQFNMQKWRALQMLMEEAAKKVFEEAEFGSSSKEFCDHMGRFFDGYKIPLPPPSDD